MILQTEHRGETTQSLPSTAETTEECRHRSERQLVHLFMPSVLPKKKNDWNQEP